MKSGNLSDMWSAEDRCRKRDDCMFSPTCAAGWCIHTHMPVFIDFRTVECPDCGSTRKITLRNSDQGLEITWWGDWTLKCLRVKMEQSRQTPRQPLEARTQPIS